MFPDQALAADQLALIENERDRLSGRIADYYAERRGIPAANRIRVSFPPGRSRISAEEFDLIYRQVVAATPESVQAYALTWAAPYRVDCMSITTAFAAGYDPAFCASPCALTRESPLYGSFTHRPYAEHGWRPTMALAGTDFAAVKALIKRGLAADETRPTGTGYLVETTDRRRSTRAIGYDRVQSQLGGAVKLVRVKADAIEGMSDVLFYFTGAVTVPLIGTNRFLPGAVADHLTSAGGQLTDSRQMSILRWLEAGATGSYGTVVEPCSFPSKFPDPGRLIAAYLSGGTLMDAYWSSVQMPGQGIFVGEPLARPYAGHELKDREGRWELRTFALRPGAYRLEGAESISGPYHPLGEVNRTGFGPLVLHLPEEPWRYYRFTLRQTEALDAR